MLSSETDRYIGRIYNTGAAVPWEFDGSNPSRSYGVLYLVYGPLLWINKWFSFEPLSIMYLARIQLALSFFIIVQISTRILCKSRQEHTKAVFFIYTSYVTWTYQSHTFSNSIETQLLLIALSLIHILRREEKLGNYKPYYLLHGLLAVVCSIGIFNRITFVAFLILPFLTLLKHFVKFKSSAVFFLMVFVIVSYGFILVDSSLFKSAELVITPLNNFLYNSDTKNLAQHGIHPRYTHILVNLPQLVGPALIPFIFRNHHKTSIPYLSVISGLVTLSIIPHQELRFLAPLVPLICICIDFTNFETPQSVEWIIRSWCVFNLVFGIIMGSLHQRGVITALEHLKSSNLTNTTQFWWKTYSPPTWLLGDLNTSNDKVVDLFGIDIEELISTVESTLNSSDGQDILLISSRSSVPLLENVSNRLRLDPIWGSKWHLDLDHFDIGDPRTFYPGIDIYKVSNLL